MRTLTVFSLLVTILLQLWIVSLLLRRKLQKRLFWFLLYIGYELLESIARLSVSGNEDLYFKVYWLTSLGGIGFIVFAVWESFQGIFWLETKQAWFRWVFWGCIGVVVAYASLRAWIFPPRASTRLVATIIDLSVGEHYLIAALGLLYFGLLRFFKVVGHQRESTIIWGFGANSTLTVLALLIRSVFVTKLALVSTWLPAIGYIVAEAAWIRDLRREEQRVPEPEISLDEVRFALGKYTEFLYRYFGRER